MLSAYNHRTLEKNKSSRGNYNDVEVRLSRKHYLTSNFNDSLIKSKHYEEICLYMYFYELGHGTVGLRRERLYVQINERIMAGMTIKRCKIKPNYQNYDSNTFMNASYCTQYKINELQKYVMYKTLTCILIIKASEKYRKHDRCYTFSVVQKRRRSLNTSAGMSKISMCKQVGQNEIYTNAKQQLLKIIKSKV